MVTLSDLTYLLRIDQERVASESPENLALPSEEEPKPSEDNQEVWEAVYIRDGPEGMEQDTLDENGKRIRTHRRTVEDIGLP